MKAKTEMRQQHSLCYQWRLSLDKKQRFRFSQRSVKSLPAAYVARLALELQPTLTASICWPEASTSQLAAPCGPMLIAECQRIVIQGLGLVCQRAASKGRAGDNQAEWGLPWSLLQGKEPHSLPNHLPHHLRRRCLWPLQKEALQPGGHLGSLEEGLAALGAY